MSTSSCQRLYQQQFVDCGYEPGFECVEKHSFRKELLFTSESWNRLCGPVLLEITAECIWVYYEHWKIAISEIELTLFLPIYLFIHLFLRQRVCSGRGRGRERTPTRSHPQHRT